MADVTRVVESKFDLGAPRPRSIDIGDIPWAYGEDRITVVVRDPESAYLYWEITDEGITSARARLGPAGAHGWCNLRVYDTTGREFDGTNANDYFDIGVDRADREYFLRIGRPTSTMHAEIGIKTHEGYFQPVARSGRGEFPREAPSPNTTLEWLSVTSDGAPPAAAPFRSRYGGPEPPLPGRAGAGYVDVWRAAYAPSPDGPAHTGAPSSVTTLHRTVEIERWWHLDEWRAEWRGGLRWTRWTSEGGLEGQAWREGPFVVELFDPERVAVELLGLGAVHLEAEGHGFVVYGPWKVTVKSFEAGPERRVVSTWTLRWVRATTPMVERWGQVLERRLVGAYEREHVLLGASERQVLLERGASELWRLGASERMWLGASEWMAMGGSEMVWVGASQLAMAGASALLYRGASEWVFRGASEWARAGASEWMGASPIGGASEQGRGIGVEGEKWAVVTWGERKA
jgi:hypothetical protein